MNRQDRDSNINTWLVALHARTGADHSQVGFKLQHNSPTGMTALPPCPYSPTTLPPARHARWTSALFVHVAKTSGKEGSNLFLFFIDLLEVAVV